MKRRKFLNLILGIPLASKLKLDGSPYLPNWYKDCIKTYNYSLTEFLFKSHPLFKELRENNSFDGGTSIQSPFTWDGHD